jgi:hypothetical protein
LGEIHSAFTVMPGILRKIKVKPTKPALMRGIGARHRPWFTNVLRFGLSLALTLW